MSLSAFARRASLACVVLAFPFVASVAHAQMSEGERKAAARAAYLDGVDLQDKGKPEQALARFEAAEKLFDAPTHLLHIAECQVLTGKLIEGFETYETLTRKSLPSGSPDAFVQAQEQGKTEMTTLRARIPTLRVTTKPEGGKLANLQISVNDREIPGELVGIARPVNPGKYRVTATATGWSTPTTASLDLTEGDAKTVELTLQQVSPTPPPPAVVVAPVPSPPPYEQETRRPKESPTSSGLLIGARFAAVVPGGSVDKAVNFTDFGTAGPGFGVDLIGRLSKIVLVGGTLEFASLGAPDASAFAKGEKVDVTARSFYIGALVGIAPNIDKFSFIGDIGLGYRAVSRSLTVTDKTTGASTPQTDDTYGGLEIAFNTGVSIPAGSLRFVPKVGVALGSFGSRSCSGSGVGVETGCATGTSDPALHTIFTAGLALYYSVDFAKK